MFIPGPKNSWHVIWNDFLYRVIDANYEKRFTVRFVKIKTAKIKYDTPVSIMMRLKIIQMYKAYTWNEI